MNKARSGQLCESNPKITSVIVSDPRSPLYGTTQESVESFIMTSVAWAPDPFHQPGRSCYMSLRMAAEAILKGTYRLATEDEAQGMTADGERRLAECRANDAKLQGRRDLNLNLVAVPRIQEAK
jgi:hypothetical protein